MSLLNSDKGWTRQTNNADRARVASYRHREARRRAQRAEARREAINHPVRTFFRWAAR